MKTKAKKPEWVTRGKTIRQLVKELLTFPDVDTEVRLSLDDGMSHHPISIVCRRGRYCVLENAEGEAAVRARQKQMHTRRSSGAHTKANKERTSRTMA